MGSVDAGRKYRGGYKVEWRVGDRAGGRGESGG